MRTLVMRVCGSILASSWLWLAGCSPDPRLEADKRFDAMDYAGAVKAYEPLFKAKSEDAELKRRYALALARSGKPAEAEPLLATLAGAGEGGIASSDPEVVAAWVDCVSLVKGPVEGWKAAQKALEKLPQAAPIQRAAGTVAAQRGETERAKGHLEKAVAIDPKEAAAWANLGDLKLAARDFIGAMELYAKAIELEPRSPMSVFTRVRMAQIVLDSDPEQAVNLMREAKSIQPELPEISAELGKVLAAVGGCDEAIELLKQAYEAKLERADVMSTLGYCFLQRGMGGQGSAGARQDLLAAKMWLGRLVAKEPAWRGAHNNLGRVHWQLGDPDAAEQAFRTELSLYPNSLEALTNLGRLLAEQGAPDRAKELLVRAFELERRQVTLAGELGRLLLQQGDVDGALGWYQTAWKLCGDTPFDHPCRVEVPYQLARIAGRKREREAAVQLFLEAVNAGFSDIGRFRAEDDLRLIQNDARLAPFLNAAR